MNPSHIYSKNFLPRYKESPRTAFNDCFQIMIILIIVITVIIMMIVTEIIITTLFTILITKIFIGNPKEKRIDYRNA